MTISEHLQCQCKASIWFTITCILVMLVVLFKTFAHSATRNILNRPVFVPINTGLPKPSHCPSPSLSTALSTHAYKRYTAVHMIVVIVSYYSLVIASKKISPYFICTAQSKLGISKYVYLKADHCCLHQSK